MSIDLFDTRTMLDALDQAKPPKTFLRDLVFTGERISDSPTVDIDIRKGKRRIVPYINPRKEGRMVERIGYTTNTYVPPYLKPKMVTTAADLYHRTPGQNIYAGNMSPAEKAAEQLGKDLAELNEIITRVEEVQCSQALQSGTITVTGDGVSDTIDFGMDASHKITLTSTDVWSHADARPLVDINTWKRLLIKDSGVNPDFLIFGSTAWDEFISHASVVSALDTRRADLASIDPRPIGQGATWVGFLKEAQLDCYVYDEWFINLSGTEVPMVDVGKVIMGSTMARAEKLYGAIQDLEAGQPTMNFSVSRFPKSWVQKDPSGQIVLLQSAPLMSLHQVDAFLYANI